LVFYAEGLEDVAALGVEVAEEIHEPLCELYDYRPDGKVSLIFSDDDDIANAATYFQSNKIHFYATSMAWDFRGTHNWLRNVVTHEYTHMIQLGAARKWWRAVPAFYVQFLGYESERRPDVLYGYPNRLMSWPLPSITVPAWLAEGTAQYQFDGSGYDYWDSHRDMLLRQAVLSGRLLSFDDMGYFGKTSLQSEEIYNLGFSLTKYIADHSDSPDVLRRISHRLANPLPVTADDAVRKATGRRGMEWYREWKADLERQYRGIQDELTPYLTKGDTVPVSGFVNLYPRLSPDGKRVAFISNQNRDYFGQSSLYIFNFDSTESEIIAPAAHGGLSWLPDGSGIVFARRGVRSSTGSRQFDLYLYLFDDKKTVRLTNGFRAESGDVSPDGSTLVLTINESGRRDLALAPMPDYRARKVKSLSREDLSYRLEALPHEQYYLPRWSPDGKHVAVACHRVDGRGVRIFAMHEQGERLVKEREFDGELLELRDPSWSEDGRSLLVAWDVDGISNIYRMDLESDSRERLTVVLGGAFYPDMRQGRLAFTDFCENGFRIRWADDATPLRLPRNSLDTNADERVPYASKIPRTTFDFDVPQPKGALYKPVFERLYWFPRIAFDYGTFKPGTYVLVNDVLEKLTFIGGFAINQKRDYDLFGLMEYRIFYPTVFAEYYNVQRRLTSHFEDSQVIVGEEGEGPNRRPVFDTYRIRFRYSLHEIEFGLRAPAGDGTEISLSTIYDSYNAHNRFDDETSIGITYFKGWAGKIALRQDRRRPGVASEINPRGGYKAYIEYRRANHLFYTDLEIGGDAVGLQEVYAPYNYDMLEGGAEKYLALPAWDHSLELRLRGGFVAQHVDPFFYLYAGGLPGMRGYSFYSLGGERIAVGTATYRFPIVPRASWNLWPLSINRIYGGLFADIGDAWNGDFDTERLKTDVGGGLRLQMHSFYSYPTALAFDVAYGFDRFSVTEQDRTTEYGREVRYYLTVLFSFYSPFSNYPDGR
ncbi:hypothetical protein KKH27_06295, partial [bacterium]|nr:hypothetical protein [bacterium]